MEIKTGKEIVSCPRSKSISELSIKPYNKKWVALDDVKEAIHKVREGKFDAEDLFKDIGGL